MCWYCVLDLSGAQADQGLPRHPQPGGREAGGGAGGQVCCDQHQEQAVQSDQGRHRVQLDIKATYRSSRAVAHEDGALVLYST